MTDEKRDPLDNPLNRFLDNPISYGVGALLVIVMVANRMIDGWYGIALIGVCAFGTYRWFQKRKGV